MFRRFVLLVVLAAVASTQAARGLSPGWPTLNDQLLADEVRRGSALEQLIAANQDFSVLRDDEAKDKIRIPLWLRVIWRKAHPEMVYSADDPTGGYPFVLKEVHEWMVSHQDLEAGPGDALRDPDREEMEERSATVSGEQRISGLQTAPRSESDIRMNYWDTQKIIGGSNNISGSGSQAMFFSTDGGTNWGQTSLPLQPGDAFHSDPTVEWTSDGTAWSTTIGINSGGTVLHMRSYKSVDNGATWTFDASFDGGQTQTDKQIIWTDHSESSPFKNNLYACWHNGLPAFMNRRTGPAGSWQTPIQVSGAESTGTAIGCDVKTNSFGDVFGFWPTTGNRRIIMVKSTNGGVSYGTPIQVATTFDSFDIGVPSFNSRRPFIYVSGGAYRTPTKDMVYATWTDLTGEAGCTAAANEPGSNVASTCKTRIWFSRSSNGGTTWSTPVMLNNQPGLNDQFSQWMVVDETTGALSIIYQDTVDDAGRKKSDVFYQSSFDDGATWFAPVKVTSAQTDETVAGADSGNQYGDYNGLTGYGGIFFPSWTDRRAGLREEIWTAKINDAACTPTGAPAIGTATATAPNQIQVTWADGSPSSTAFNVYRAVGTCASPGSFTRVGTAVAGSPFNDNTVSGTIHYAYFVRGLDATGNCESPNSGCVEATATGACTLPPTFAGLASVTNSASATCGLNLSWAAATPACAGPITYNVYRSTTSGFVPGAGNQIATGVSGTSYNDTGTLVANTIYYYVVRAVDTSNSVAETNTVQKSAYPTGPIATTNLTETFEAGGGFDLPGWTHAAVQGANDWALSTSQSQTPTHSWFSDSLPSVSERVLVSPPFSPQAGSTLSFWHTFAFENTTSCFDAGTLEVSTDGGGSWTVMPDANFTAGGFTGTVSAGFSSPIGGKRAWCNGTIGPMTQVTANLGSFSSFPDVRLRWHAADDESVEATGWFVDSVTLSSVGVGGTCSTTAAAGLGFHTVTPCRMVDTRNPAGPLGGPVLAANATRTFILGGTCGVPLTAKSLALNITVTNQTASGFLKAYPADQVAPDTSVINFKPGYTRANNSILSVDGTGSVKVDNGSTGTVHLLIDVVGYFE